MESEELVKLRKAQETFKQFCAKEKNRNLIIQEIMNHIYELAEYSKCMELNRQIFVGIKECLDNIMHALRQFKIFDTFLTTNINVIAEYLFLNFNNICIKTLVLKFLINAISSLSKRNEKLGHVFMTSSSLLSLFDLIKCTGSYEVQFLTLKMLVKLYGLDTLKERIVERPAYFPKPRVFVAIREKHLERDLRLYLNQVNLMNKNVYSIKAVLIKIELEPLKFTEGKGSMWVDFNILNQEVIFDCGNIVLDSLRSESNNRLERLYFQSCDIATYWVSLRQSRCTITFKLNKPCFSETIQFSNSLKGGMKIEFCFMDCDILQSLLNVLPSFVPIRTEGGKISGFTKNVYRPSRAISIGKKGKSMKDTSCNESIFNISKSSKSDRITISDSDEYETALDFFENKKEKRTANTKQKEDNFKNLNVHTAKKTILDIESNTESKNMTVSRPVCSNKLKTYSKDLDSDSSIEITADVNFNAICIVHQEKDAVIKNKIQNQQEVDINSERFDASLIVKSNQCNDIVEHLTSKKRDIRSVSVDSTQISAGTYESNGSKNLSDESLILAQISPIITKENSDFEETGENENQSIEEYQAQSIDLSGSFISAQISPNENFEKLQHLTENTNISQENASESYGINKSQNDHHKDQSQQIIHENSPKSSQLDKNFNNVINNNTLNNPPPCEQTNKLNLLYEENSQKLINEKCPKNSDLDNSFNKVICDNDSESCDKNKFPNDSPVGEHTNKINLLHEEKSDKLIKENSPKNSQLDTSFDNYIKDLTGQNAQSLLLLNEISSHHSELDNKSSAQNKQTTELKLLHEHQSLQLSNETSPQYKELDNTEQDHDPESSDKDKSLNEPLAHNPDTDSIGEEKFMPKLRAQQYPENKNKRLKRQISWSENQTKSEEVKILPQKVIPCGDNKKRQNKCPNQQRQPKKKLKIQNKIPQKQLVININRMDFNKKIYIEEEEDNDLVTKSDEENAQIQAKKAILDSIFSQSTVCLTQNVEKYTKNVPSSGSELSEKSNGRINILQDVVLNTANNIPRHLSENDDENEELVNILSRENPTMSNALDVDETFSRKRKLSEIDDENENFPNFLSQEKEVISESMHVDESALTKRKSPEIDIERENIFDTFRNNAVNDICYESDSKNEYDIFKDHKTIKSRVNDVKSIPKEKDISNATLVKTRTLFNPDDISYLHDTLNPEKQTKNLNLQTSKISKKVVEDGPFGRLSPIRMLSGTAKNTEIDIEKSKPAKKNKRYKDKMPRENYSTKMLNSILRPSSLKPKRTKNGYYSKRNWKLFSTRQFTLSDDSDQEQCTITYDSILNSLKNTYGWNPPNEKEVAENDKNLIDLEIEHDLTSTLELITRKLKIAVNGESKYVPALKSIERVIRKALKPKK